MQKELRKLEEKEGREEKLGPDFRGDYLNTFSPVQRSTGVPQEVQSSGRAADKEGRHRDLRSKKRYINHWHTLVLYNPTLP